jgi:hypothetical protein
MMVIFSVTEYLHGASAMTLSAFYEMDSDDDRLD